MFNIVIAYYFIYDNEKITRKHTIKYWNEIVIFFIYVQLLILNINTFVKNFKIIKNEFLFFRFLDRWNSFIKYIKQLDFINL